MLQTLYDYAVDYYARNGVGIMVNALAGSSHSVNSYHVRNDFTHCKDFSVYSEIPYTVELDLPDK